MSIAATSKDTYQNQLKVGCNLSVVSLKKEKHIFDMNLMLG